MLYYPITFSCHKLSIPVQFIYVSGLKTLIALTQVKIKREIYNQHT